MKRTLNAETVEYSGKQAKESYKGVVLK